MRAAALAALAFGILAPSAAYAELTLCNRTSYRMDAAIGLEKRANVETRGWFRIDPGACRQVLDGPYDAEMAYVYARTPQVYGSAPLPQNGNSDFCIRDGDFTITNGRECPVSQQAHFSAIRLGQGPDGSQRARLDWPVFGQAASIHFQPLPDKVICGFVRALQAYTVFSGKEVGDKR